MAVRLILNFDHFDAPPVEVPAEGTIIVGRKSIDEFEKKRCDLELESYLHRPLPLVSRQHLEIFFDLDRFVVRDLGSTNKTRLNGRELHPDMLYALSDGGILSLANDQVTIRVEIRRETDATPALMDVETPPSMMIRQQEISFVADRLLHRQNVHLCGPHGIGKTEVMRLLAARPVADNLLGLRQFLCCHVDMHSLSDYSESVICHLLIEGMCEAVKGDARAASIQGSLEGLLQGLKQGESTGRPYSALRQAVDLVSERAFRSVVLLLDHFEDVCKDAPQSLLPALISVSQESRLGLLYVIAATDEFWHLAPHQGQVDIYDSFQDFLGPPLWLSVLEEQHPYHILRSKGQMLTDELMQYALHLSGGWPSLLVGLLDALQINGQRLRQMPLDHAVAELLEASGAGSIGQKCGLIWNDLDADEQTVLRRLAAQQPHNDRRTLARLARKSLVQWRDERTAPRLSSPILEQFIAFVAQNMSGPATAVDRQPALKGLWLEPKSGDVWVDGQSVTEGRPLSKLRYRLLKYLYDHPREVCSIDQIIEAIHPDESGDGVSDQSIARLIKTLREAIEPDPARPRFIRTLSGRGYFCDPEGTGH